MKVPVLKIKDIFSFRNTRFLLSSLPVFIMWMLLAGLSAACSGTAYRDAEGIAWNTAYHISYESELDLGDSVRMIFNEIDRSVSAFNDTSTVSRINRNETVHVDTHFRNVYNKSREINQATDGMFDPTLAPLIRAWGFGQGHEVSADTLRIDSLLNFVGITKTRLDGEQLYKENPNIEFNFSALAKGYGVDGIASMLERNGVSNYLVEVGGEIRASGVNRSGNQWTVGIDTPVPDEDKADNSPMTTISATDFGMATSGNYRNFQKTSESGTFGHTISPLTGRPVSTDLASVTIIVPAGTQPQSDLPATDNAWPCMTADAIATSCMALGLEASQELCSRLRVAALFITTDLKVVTNPAYRALIH